MVSAISFGWFAVLEKPLPLFNGNRNRIILTTGKHPLSPSYTKQFSSSIEREDSREESQKKKRFDEAEEIANRNMGARKQYSSINFLGGFIEGMS